MTRNVNSYHRNVIHIKNSKIHISMLQKFKIFHFILYFIEISNKVNSN